MHSEIIFVWQIASSRVLTCLCYTEMPQFLKSLEFFKNLYSVLFMHSFNFYIIQPFIILLEIWKMGPELQSSCTLQLLEIETTRDRKVVFVLRMIAYDILLFFICFIEEANCIELMRDTF